MTRRTRWWERRLLEAAVILQALPGLLLAVGISVLVIWASFAIGAAFNVDRGPQ